MRFAQEDLDIFSRVSGDTNPLHLSETYARKSVFGQLVVFGALGALRILPKEKMTALKIELQQPIFLDVPYQTNTSKQGNIKLSDGKRTLLTISADNAPVEAPNLTPPPSQPKTVGMNKYTFNELKVGQYESHSYVVAPEFTQLLERYELQAAPVPALAILWSSFLIGMRFPGESALYSGADFIFYQDHIGDLSSLKYNLEIVGLDERFQLVELKATLWSGTTLLTSAELRCFVRQTAEPQKQFVAAPNARLLGKVALVTGASRGLGRALTLALAQEGAIVYANFRQSVEEAQELLALAPSGKIILSKGDAGDLDYCTQAIATILRENKQLDFLFCNAAPAILPFWIEENTFVRIQSFMSQSFALIHAPFSAALPKLSPGGKVVVLSSSALKNSPAEWPHYAAAKVAWEEFTRVAQKQYPKLSFYIARPPKLATDLTNTPTGWQDAQEPEVVAKLIVEAIIKQPPSNPEIIELF